MTEGLGYTMEDFRLAVADVHSEGIDVSSHLEMLIKDFNRLPLLNIAKVVRDGNDLLVTRRGFDPEDAEARALGLAAMLERGVAIGLAMAERKAGLRP